MYRTASVGCRLEAVDLPVRRVLRHLFPVPHDFREVLIQHADLCSHVLQVLWWRRAGQGEQEEEGVR